MWTLRPDSNRRPSDYESDARRRPGRLQTDPGCSGGGRVGPDGSRRIPTDRRDDQGASDRTSAATASRTRAGRQFSSRERPPDPPPAADACPGRRIFRATSPPSDEGQGARPGPGSTGRTREAPEHHPDRGWAWPEGRLCPLLVETPRSASGPPERLPAGRVRGPDDHRAVGGDGAVRPGPGPGGALRPVGPDPVAGPGVVGIRQLPAAADEVPAAPQRHPPDP